MPKLLAPFMTLWHPPLTHVAREVVAPCASPGYLDARYDNAT